MLIESTLRKNKDSKRNTRKLKEAFLKSKNSIPSIHPLIVSPSHLLKLKKKPDQWRKKWQPRSSKNIDVTLIKIDCNHSSLDRLTFIFHRIIRYRIRNQESKNQGSRKIANAQLDIYDHSQQIVPHSLSTWKSTYWFNLTLFNLSFDLVKSSNQCFKHVNNNPLIFRHFKTFQE